MSRDILPRRLDADTFLSRHSAQPFERALGIEWSCSGDVVSCFVSSHETVRSFFSPVVPFHCCDGAIRFLNSKPDSYPRYEWQRMVLSETRGLWLSWIVREGIGWIRRLACLKHGPDLYDGCFPSNPSVSRTRQLPPGIVPQVERTLCQRRSSCLLFQIVGVETYLLLPNDQRDRGNLPRQGQARHRGLPSLSQQGLVEIA